MGELWIDFETSLYLNRVYSEKKNHLSLIGKYIISFNDNHWKYSGILDSTMDASSCRTLVLKWKNSKHVHTNVLCSNVIFDQNRFYLP